MRGWPRHRPAGNAVFFYAATLASQYYSLPGAGVQRVGHGDKSGFADSERCTPAPIGQRYYPQNSVLMPPNSGGYALA